MMFFREGEKILETVLVSIVCLLFVLELFYHSLYKCINTFFMGK